jgi:MFS family permease
MKGTEVGAAKVVCSPAGRDDAGALDATTVARGAGLLALLLAPLAMTQADATIVNVANPSIQADLHATGTELQLVVGGYLITFAMLLITGARLGESHGHRRLFLTGLAVFTLASLGCGLAPSPIELIAARILQGVGAAMTVPQVLTGIQLHFRGAQRVRALSLYGAALASGSIAGQILGGVLVSADLFGAHWRPIFLINVPVGAIVLIRGVRTLPRDGPRDARRPTDLLGVVTLSSALLLIVLPLMIGRQQHWPWWTWACLAASVPSMLAFLRIERRLDARGGDPLVNVRMLSRPAILWGLCPQAAAVSTYYAVLFTIPLYLQESLGRSPLNSGLSLAAFVGTFGLASLSVGRMPSRLKTAVAPAGAITLAVAYCAISVSAFAGNTSGVLLLLLLGVGGLGLGGMFNAMVDHLTAAATPRFAADISGVFTTSLQVAGAIGVATLGTVYLNLVARGGIGNASRAFAVVTGSCAIIACVAAWTARRATRSRLSPFGETPAAPR